MREKVYRWVSKASASYVMGDVKELSCGVKDNLLVGKR